MFIVNEIVDEIALSIYEGIGDEQLSQVGYVIDTIKKEWKRLPGIYFDDLLYHIGSVLKSNLDYIISQIRLKKVYINVKSENLFIVAPNLEIEGCKVSHRTSNHKTIKIKKTNTINNSFSNNYELLSDEMEIWHWYVLSDYLIEESESYLRLKRIIRNNPLTEFINALLHH